MGSPVPSGSWRQHPQDLGVLAKRVPWGGPMAVWDKGGPQGAGGPRQEASRDTQVGNKDLERSLGEIRQGVSPGAPSGGVGTTGAGVMGTARGQSQPARGSSGGCTVLTAPQRSSSGVWW